MNHFPGAQEFKGFTYFRVFDDTDQVIIGGPGLLLRGQVLVKIRDGISLGLEFAGIERHAGCSGWPQGSGVVDIIRVKPSGFCLFRSQVLGQLIDNGADHFQVCKLLCTNICQQSAYLLAWHGVALGKITHGCGKLSVRTAELADD